MIVNAFAGRPDPPLEADLVAALGDAKALWDQLLAELEADCGLTGREWNSYSRKAGWALRLKLGERNIVYLTPGRGEMMASFALGDKAVEAARKAKLPTAVMRVIDEAKRYAEGTGVRLEVRGVKDITVVKKLAAIKIAN